MHVRRNGEPAQTESWNARDGTNLFLKLQEKVGHHHVVRKILNSCSVKVTLVLGVQYFPHSDKTDPEEAFLFLRKAINTSKRDVFIKINTDTDKLKTNAYAHWNNLVSSRRLGPFETDRRPKNPDKTSSFFQLLKQFLQEMLCAACTNYLYWKHNFSRMDVSC